MQPLGAVCISDWLAEFLMMNYYNEHDPKAATWLCELIAAGRIPAGDVDERSIIEVTANEITDYTQCHFFAGIGGWPLALKLAAWPETTKVWTGSCPCQPFSDAGRGMGEADERHLWPVFRNLIGKCRPAIVFGEQVASSAGLIWLDGVCADMEAAGYAFGAADLCAASVGAPHVRQRLYWTAYASSNGRQRIQSGARAQISKDRTPEALGSWNATGSPFQNWKILLAQSHVGRVDDGVSSGVDIRPRLRAYGNAIVPQLAARFVEACDYSANDGFR